jgi:hypothetical protein
LGWEFSGIWADKSGKEKYVKEQVVFLEGLLPLDDSPIFLPGIKTEDGLSADVHLF